MNQQQTRVRAIVAALSLIIVGAAGAAGLQQDFKQLSGPAEEFAALRPADPAAAAISSRSALIPVALQQAADGRWSWQSELAVDGSELRLLLLAGGDTGWQIALTAPGARSAVSAATLRSSFEQSRYGMAGNDYPAELHGFSNLQTGRWTIQVLADSPVSTRGFLLVEGAGPDRLVAQQTAYNQRRGERLGFTARLAAEDTMGGKEERLAGRMDSAILRVSAPDGSERRVTMADDGRHADGLAGDGVFGADFLAEQAGNYNVQVIASGLGVAGQPFQRTSEHLVPVVDPTLQLSAGVVHSEVVSDRRLAIRLPTTERSAEGRNYRVIAELWGQGRSDVMRGATAVPIAWIGGLSHSANGQLELGLDARWIARSGATGPFELRNVRIEEADHFVEVASAARLPVSMPSLPAAASQRGVSDPDEEMLMGVRPRQQSLAGVGTKLLLVHGYCSGNVWGGVAGQFSNAAVFQDLNQNRSHDAFAQRIKTFGATWNSFGIVAHSQGGAAALHLYTYYWSGLDNAVLTGGKRLIQSVGTPYQGTNLAGNLAAIGQVFGAGCGTNTNLTYSGASSWLAGISTTRRAKVNYYTTSFTDRSWVPDWCHIATDLLLSDPDDGTTERAYGQLSGAVNQGHKTGWCHTSGMRDPAQTTDSSRNATMNSNAAR